MQPSFLSKLTEKIKHFLDSNQEEQAPPSSADAETALPEENPIAQTETIFGAVVSDVGCVRSNNEDNYILGATINFSSADRSTASVRFSQTLGKWYFAGVFDGMGGGEMGEVASKDTAEIFWETIARLEATASKEMVDRCVRNAFLQANNRIVDLQKEHQIFGTTGTVLCCNDTEFKFYHLGDSRAYLVRDHQLSQLTKDQTLAQMKLEVGMYQEDDPAAEADKHKLTEYIGRDWTRENLKPVESLWMPFESGDFILLCSDGLYDMCTSEEITAVLQSGKPLMDTVTSLVEKARSKGGEDNITCILMEHT